MKPFISNRQYNLIKKQTGNLQHASKTVADPKVVEAVRYNAEARVIEAFPEITDQQKEVLERISELKTTEDFQSFLNSLAPFLVEFPRVTEQQVRKLFPKNKKMKVPDLSAIDHRFLTYLSWVDIATNKLFIVYHLNGELVGVEGKYTPSNKKDVCSLCKGYGEVALVTAVAKKRPANASPDYYKALGNYMCVHSHECNKNITEVTQLEKFIHNVIG